MLRLTLIILSYFLVSCNAQTPVFVSPTNGNTYIFGATVPVRVNYVTSVQVNVSQTCSTQILTQILTTNVTKNFTIPLGYSGICVYTTNFTSPIPQATPVQVNIITGARITTPTDSSALSKIPANSSTPIQIYYSPTTSPNVVFGVTLNCSSSLVTSALIEGGLTNQTFFVPQNFYGVACVFKIVNSTGTVSYQSDPVLVTITQVLSLTNPPDGLMVVNPNAFPLGTTTGFVTLYDAFRFNMACDVNSGSIAKTTNTNYSITYPSQTFYGTCKCLLSDMPGYYTIPPQRTIYIQYSLTYVTAPVQIYSGVPFDLKLGTKAGLAVPSPLYLSTLGLFCDNISTFNWTTVAVNALITLTLNNTQNTSNNCYFLTMSATKAFVDTRQNVTVISYIITITSPPSGSTLMAGSSYTVTWSVSSGSTVGNTFNVSLVCGGFPTISSILPNANITTISIPSTYYSSSCTLSVTSPYLISDSMSVIVAQTLSIDTPTNGTVFALPPSSISVKLITSGNNIVTNVTTRLSCSTGSPTTNLLLTNTNSLTQSIATTQSGQCTFTIISAPSYLVYSSSAYFSLKYTLTFTSLPPIIYRGQNFSIQIDTVSTMDSPPAATLSLICPTNLIIATWTGILINQPNILRLRSDVPLDSCFFNVSNDSYYDAASSSVVTVSKVPVVINVSGGAGPYPKPLAVPLKVSTTVSPVSGTVLLLLTCPSLTTPFPVTIPINVQGSFTYPSTAYGKCRLGIDLNDPIFA